MATKTEKKRKQQENKKKKIIREPLALETYARITS